MSLKYNSKTLNIQSATIGVGNNYTEIGTNGRLGFFGSAKNR